MKEKIDKIQMTALIVAVLAAAYFTFPKKIDNQKQEPQVQTTINQIAPTDLNESKPAAPANLITANSVKVPVLMYHHVADWSADRRKQDPTGSDLTVSVADFESQVKYFHDKGYVSVSVEAVYQALINHKALPGKPIVFTFDDGYEDVFVNAIPILEKYGYTGSFAIITDLLGQPDYATWKDVLAADKSGMEILSHTENHLDLTSAKYTHEDLTKEVLGSKQKLEDKLGHPVDFFIYPYGDENPAVAEMVQQAGYKMAFTTKYGLFISYQNLFTEPRVRVHGLDGLEKLKLIFEPKPIVHTDPVPTNP